MPIEIDWVLIKRKVHHIFISIFESTDQILDMKLMNLRNLLLTLEKTMGKNWRVWKIKEKLNGSEDEENEDCLSLGTKGKYILTQSHQYVVQHVDPFLEIYFRLYQTIYIMTLLLLMILNNFWLIEGDLRSFKSLSPPLSSFL